jgi:hypothetical protein
MAQAGQRKCLCCGRFFEPDHRNRKRQRYCAGRACRRASKAASQAAWLSHPENVGYFGGSVHVARAQDWRATHPGRAQVKRPRGSRLQDALIVQVVDPIEESVIHSAPLVAAAPGALQDDLQALSPALAGLIAHVFALTLQDDMANTTRRLVQLGQDVVKGSARW